MNGAYLLVPSKFLINSYKSWRVLGTVNFRICLENMIKKLMMT